MKENAMPVYVLLRFSKKTGKIDTTMTGITSAMMEFWALNNTTKTKATVVCERDTGKIVFLAKGTDSGFPNAKSEKRNGEIGNISDWGIPLDVLRTEFTDDRFDK